MQGKIKHSPVTVPVMVDDVKKLPEFQMTRCTYFSIACDVPGPGWILELAAGDPVPFFMVGMSGIIHRPSIEQDEFTKPKHIDDLFNLIEENENLFVDINDFWLPNGLFSGSSSVESGQVFRIGEELFRQAYKHGTDFLAAMKLGEKSDRSLGKAMFSESETRAFEKWQIAHIEGAKKEYRQRKEENDKSILLKVKEKG